MKIKIYILFVLIMFACMPLEVQAVEHNFPAGSIIIPMDKFYQPADATDQQDGGILEAYGLVYNLLAHQDQTDLAACQSEPDATSKETCRALSLHDITVYWIIDENKTNIASPDLIIEQVRTEKTVTRGFNAQTMEHTDLVKAGIVDPTKVVRHALQNAASVSALLLTTEALISELPDDDGDGPGAGGGMGDF